MPTVLAVLAEGFEEIEAIAPVDLLRRAGAEVTMAALGPSLVVTGRTGVAVHADTLLDNVANTTFDALFLPGGPGTKHLRADPRIAPLAKRHHAAGKLVAAICAAPTVLHDAGLLNGRRYTAHFSVEAELPQVRRDERVVRDGNLITSRGAGTAVEFGLALVDYLYSAAHSREVAASICF